MKLNEIFQQAVTHHHAGRFAEAEELYRSVLQVEPKHPDANHNLGLMAMQLSQAEKGLPYLQAAWEADPSTGEYWLTLTECLLETGHPEDALLLIEDAIRRGMDSPQAQQLLRRLKDSHDSGAQPADTAVEESEASTVAQAGNKSAKPDKPAGKFAPHQKKNPSTQEINILVSLFTGGRYADAATVAQAMTARFPLYGFGWKVLGATFRQMGRDVDALVPMQKAAALSPNDAEVHNNLGVLLQAQGRLEAALASLRRALELKPDYANAHNSLGSILDDLGQFEAAQASYRRALELNPDFADAHNNMGVALKDQGQFAAAAASLRRAIELKPDYAEAHNNLGIVLNAQGQFDAAQASCRRALELNPNYAEAHYSLGCALNDQGQFEAARASYCRALELKPDYADAHYSLGVVLNAQGQLDAARASYRRAVEIDPGHAEAHNNLGIIQMEQGQLDDAQASFRHALDIKPNYFECYSNLLFCGNYDINLAREESFDLAKHFGALVAGKAKPFKEWNVPAEPRRRIRVGVVSGDLRKHSVSYFLGSVLDNLDKNQIELVAYPTQVKTDAVTDRLRRHFSQWNPLTDCSDDDAAQRIYGDRVDILLDLSGHTAKNRLPIFAWRPAPIQVSWLGYFATTGMAEMDYLLADKVGVPASELEQFTESVWYLPNTRMCFTAPEVAIPVAPLPALANSNITFGCFQTATKVNDSVLAVWGKIFAELPNAKLRMQCNKLGEPAQVKQMLQRLQRYGIDPARVLVHGTTSRETYLVAHAEVDIILDTFPFTGGTTTSEALWMGVPTLTLAGSSLLARQGASLLTAAGLEEWVAVDEEEYITKAVSYGRNLERLSELRRCLRAKVLSSPLFDAPLFAKDFEAALRGMWQVWCEKQQVHTT